jgi:hypothetical protein
MKLTNSMMEALRGRRGLEENDTSLDEEILKMDPVEVVQECSAWYLGDSSWASIIAGWIVASGAKPEHFMGMGKWR